ANKGRSCPVSLQRLNQIERITSMGPEPKAHHAMKQDARRLRIEWRMNGPFEPKPDDDESVPRPTGRRLEAVA
ncbi:hypothetical protein, partial [Brevundimonas staleyi]